MLMTQQRYQIKPNLQAIGMATYTGAVPCGTLVMRTGDLDLFLASTRRAAAAAADAVGCVRRGAPARRTTPRRLPWQRLRRWGTHGRTRAAATAIAPDGHVPRSECPLRSRVWRTEVCACICVCGEDECGGGGSGSSRLPSAWVPGCLWVPDCGQTRAARRW